MTNFLTRKINDNLGIIIEGIDLSETLSNENFSKINNLFFDNHIIIFKNQKLKEEDQLLFTKKFGDLEIYPEADKTKKSPQTYHVANVSLDGHHLNDQDEQVIFQKINQKWHTDSSYRFIPSYASLLYSIEVLPADAEGGETEFVNMFKVYESLNSTLKNKLESLHMVHYFEFGRRMYPELPPMNAFERENIPPVSHPLIRLHPDRNNKKSLFFTANTGKEISGLTQETGALLHSDLVKIVNNSSYKYKHRWDKGDLVMWDNRCLLHRAIPYNMNKYRRVFRRTTIAGIGPIKGPYTNSN